MVKRHKWQHIQFKGSDGEYHTSYSKCGVCDVKRKTWRYKDDHYQYPDGSSVFGKAPPCCEWQPILFDSCTCSGDIEVFTYAGPEKFNSGDPVKCKVCEKLGKMLSDPESTTNYRLQWN